jgi:hypothetical protein
MTVRMLVLECGADVNALPTDAIWRTFHELSLLLVLPLVLYSWRRESEPGCMKKRDCGHLRPILSPPSQSIKRGRHS